jgi:hypothetical protein
MATLVISYSHVDRALVRAVVVFLTTAMRDIDKAVYWDGHLEPGEAWFAKIRSQILEAQQLFVFWCAHAATSHQVRQEFTFALDKGKRVVPVLLDDTPLCDELAPIHGVDLRDVVQHAQPPEARTPRSIGTDLKEWTIRIRHTISTKWDNLLGRDVRYYVISRDELEYHRHLGALERHRSEVLTGFAPLVR